MRVTEGKRGGGCGGERWPVVAISAVAGWDQAGIGVLVLFFVFPLK